VSEIRRWWKDASSKRLGRRCRLLPGILYGEGERPSMKLPPYRFSLDWRMADGDLDRGMLILICFGSSLVAQGGEAHCWLGLVRFIDHENSIHQQSPVAARITE
jgi:hypothetical protein